MDNLTAQNIAQKTGLDIHVVRYRLTMLRASGEVKYNQYGTTYAYGEDAVEKVKTFGKGK